MVDYGGNENIRLADVRSGINNDGYMLANTNGDEHEGEDEDEEQGPVQSEIDGISQALHHTHDLSAKAGIIVVCPSRTCTILMI